MRTKQTGTKDAPAVNGKSNAEGATKSDESKSSAAASTQPQLSEGEAHKIRTWLDKTERPFDVHTVPLSRKRKRDAQAWPVQDDLWNERLSVQYEVKPRDKWEKLRRYKKFTVGSESIATGQCILVKFDNSEDAKIDIPNQWKAKVLEVRALDSEHVYIRVAWLNRPEDLSSGRKDYHGKNELIPTNQMDIIDAMCVNGSLEVVHWDDNGDDMTPVGNDQYFWRQTYDFANKTFSKLRLICIDHTPQNPDEMILQCSNEACRKWQHVKCIAEKAVQQAAGETPGATKKERPKNLKIDSQSPAIARAVNATFTADIYIKGMPEAPDVAATETEIVLTAANGEQHTEVLRCLHCGHTIED